MGRPAHVPLEIDFIFSIHKSRFIEMSFNERMLYIYIWSHMWQSHSGKGEMKDEFTVGEACVIVRQTLGKPNVTPVWLKGICKVNLIEETEIGYKMLGIRQKREKAFPDRWSKCTESAPVSVRKEEGRRKKEKEKEEGSEKDTSLSPHINSLLSAYRKNSENIPQIAGDICIKYLQTALDGGATPERLMELIKSPDNANLAIFKITDKASESPQKRFESDEYAKARDALYSRGQHGYEIPEELRPQTDEICAHFNHDNDAIGRFLNR